MAGTDLYWGHGEHALLELVEDAADPGVPERARARLRAGRSRAVLLAGALGGAEGRRRRARGRRADGLPPRVRRRLRRGHGDRRGRCPPSPSAATRARSPPSATGRSRDAERAARGGRRSGRSRASAWVAELRAAETERREAERAEFEDDRAPLHPMRLYAELATDARPRRDRDRRRRRLRLLCGPRDRQLPAPAAGSTRGRSAASGPGPATRSRRSSRTPTGRS